MPLLVDVVHPSPEWKGWILDDKVGTVFYYHPFGDEIISQSAASKVLIQEFDIMAVVHCWEGPTKAAAKAAWSLQDNIANRITALMESTYGNNINTSPQEVNQVLITLRHNVRVTPVANPAGHWMFSLKIGLALYLRDNPCGVALQTMKKPFDRYWLDKFNYVIPEAPDMEYAEVGPWMERQVRKALGFGDLVRVTRQPRIEVLA